MTFGLYLHHFTRHFEHFWVMVHSNLASGTVYGKVKVERKKKNKNKTNIEVKNRKAVSKRCLFWDSGHTFNLPVQ